HPRRDRLPEEPEGARPDDRGACPGGRQAAPGPGAVAGLQRTAPGGPTGMSAVTAAAGLRPAGAGELAGVLVLLAALRGAQPAAAGAFSLFGRHFWLDEMYSQRLAADPDLGHMLAALRGGVETHPPTFYLLLRGFALLAGGATETALRG